MNLCNYIYYIYSKPDHLKMFKNSETRMRDKRKLSRTLSTIDKQTLQQLAADIDRASDNPKYIYNRRSCPIGTALFSPDREGQLSPTINLMTRRRSRSENSFFDRDTSEATQSGQRNRFLTASKIVTLCIYIKNNIFKK